MIGRALYAALFCLAIPALAWRWCAAAEMFMTQWPMLKSPWLGWPLVGLGAELVFAGWWALWFVGGGLPMNAYPPQRRVESGVFAWTTHPIYTGAVLLAAGLSILTASRAGLWIATPVLALACAALVWGFERDRTDRLLGPPRSQTLLRLPPADPAPGKAWDRVSALVLLFLPWAIIYEALGHVPVPDAIDARFDFERAWPPLTWTTPAYSSCYPLALATIFVSRSRADIRRLMLTGGVATALGAWCYLVIPLTAPPVGEPSGLFAPLLNLERADALEGRAAFPSFHVFWACAGAWALSRRWPKSRWAWWGWAGAVALSCVTTGMHAIIDVPAGILLFVVAANAGTIWRFILFASQRLANLWKEWRVGPVRVLVHAPYAFASAAAAAATIIWLTGANDPVALWAVALGGLMGAGVWGQWLEYLGKLARPFGYYGHMLGCGITLSLLALWSRLDWQLGAAIATAAPIAQALGRVRCLVNGCCHGRPCPPALGIIYTGTRSRVARLASLAGVPVHPTQTYSIIANLAASGLLLRLWSAGAPSSCAVGLYLLLAGLTRFVEEHYRGEPQTPTVMGLRSYQWLAIVSVLIGAAVAVVPSPALAWPGTFPLAAFLLHAPPIGIVYALAMGVDFPGSSRRFARLA